MVDLEQIEIERAQRKELLAEQRRQQHAIDIARLNELEIEHGDDGVARVDVGRYAPGLPTLVVVRPLKKAELKRFRDRVRGEGADNAAAPRCFTRRATATNGVRCSTLCPACSCARAWPRWS